MRKYLNMIIVAAAFLLPQFASAQNAELKVMSYNIRMGSANDGTNSWVYRCGGTIEMLEDQMPDVFGVQEALKDQLDFIKEFADNYKWVGVGRDDGKKAGEYMAIFWNKKTMKLIDWGTFWLSETPNEPSMGWDAACMRTATWALMKDKRTGKRFYFVNTHLDHVGVEARKNGLKLIVDSIAEINPEGYPMVLTGDFNIKPTAAELKDLDSRMKSARKFASKTDSHATFNNWGKAKADEIIDYIYYSGFSSCLEYQTVTKKYYDRKFISDHYPIAARLIF
ncbi:MAG: endonuclease/exonuclease/phosphatase family protein [Bacteroidales bacterium]|nr:endonuclease/exonuclease/phosphatase family protein [Bacteroidales bacterium]